MISVCRSKRARNRLNCCASAVFAGIRFSIFLTGKIVEIDANEDSEAVAEMLEKKAAAGVEEVIRLRL